MVYLLSILFTVSASVSVAGGSDAVRCSFEALPPNLQTAATELARAFSTEEFGDLDLLLRACCGAPLSGVAANHAGKERAASVLNWVWTTQKTEPFLARIKSARFHDQPLIESLQKFFEDPQAPPPQPDPYQATGREPQPPERTLQGAAETLTKGFAIHDLKQLLLFGLNINIDVIAGGGNDVQRFAQVIEYIQRNDRVSEFLSAVREAKPIRRDIVSDLETYFGRSSPQTMAPPAPPQQSPPVPPQVTASIHTTPQSPASPQPPKATLPAQTTVSQPAPVQSKNASTEWTRRIDAAVKHAMERGKAASSDAWHLLAAQLPKSQEDFIAKFSPSLGETPSLGEKNARELYLETTGLDALGAAYRIFEFLDSRGRFQEAISLLGGLRAFPPPPPKEGKTPEEKAAWNKRIATARVEAERRGSIRTQAIRDLIVDKTGGSLPRIITMLVPALGEDGAMELGLPLPRGIPANELVRELLVKICSYYSAMQDQLRILDSMREELE